MNLTKYIVLLLPVLFPVSLFAQGVEITAGANITVSGASSIQIVNGDFINNGSYVKGNETLTMSGSTAKQISGNNNTEIYNLIVSNTAGITTLLEQLTANNISIANGSKFTIPAQKSVQVSTLLTNNAGTGGLVIKSDVNFQNASLIFNNPVETPVLATVEMYSKAAAVNSNPYSDYKWQFFGIPLRNLVSASPTFNGSFVRKYYESAMDNTGSWVSLNNNSSLTPFDGYEITQASARTIYFQGELLNSNQSKLLGYTSGAIYKGNHILSNPYTAAIDIRKMTFGANMENAVYLYNTGSHADWVANGSLTNGNNPGQYSASTPNTAGTSIDGYSIPLQIPSMQGFMVKNTAATTFTLDYNSVKMNNQTPQRVNNSDQTENQKIFSLIEVKASKYTDQLWLFQNDACSHNFDNGWDARKNMSSVALPQIFAIEKDGDYQISAVDNYDQTILGFRNGVDSLYTLKFVHQNLEKTSKNLYLYDILKKTLTDITASGTEYVFEANPTAEPTSRFKILTQNEMTDKLSNKITDNIKIYFVGKSIFIDNRNNISGQYCIYNLSGSLLMKNEFEGFKVTEHQINLPTGIYLVKIENESVNTTTKIIAE